MDYNSEDEFTSVVAKDRTSRQLQRPIPQVSEKRHSDVLQTSSRRFNVESIDIDGEAKEHIESDSGSKSDTVKEESENSRSSSPNVTTIKATHASRVSETDSTSKPATNKSPPTVRKPNYRKPFRYGWIRAVIYRVTRGKSHRRADIYHYTRNGKRTRTKREIAEHLTNTKLTVHNFSFSRRPLGLDTKKEIIREATRPRQQFDFKTLIRRQKPAETKERAGKETREEKRATAPAALAAATVATSSDRPAPILEQRLDNRQCLKCGTWFAETSGLKRHLLYVCGEGVECVCTICNATFSRPDSLKVHMKHIHTIKPRYTCKNCDWDYKFKSCLDRHMLQCGKNRQFTCDTCKTEFSRADSLQRHIHHFHGKPRKTDDIKDTVVKETSTDLQENALIESHCKDLSIMPTEKLNVDFMSTPSEQLDISLGSVSSPSANSSNSTEKPDFLEISDSEFNEFLKNCKSTLAKEFPDVQVFNTYLSKLQEAIKSSTEISKTEAIPSTSYVNIPDPRNHTACLNTLLNDLPLKFDASAENDEQIRILDFDERGSFLPYNNLPKSSTNFETNAFNICPRSTGTLSTGSKETLNERDKKIRKAINRISKDQSLICTIRNETKPSKQVIMTKLMIQLLQVLAAHENKDNKVFHVRRLAKWNNCVFINGKLQMKDAQTAEITIIRYEATYSRLRFILLFKLMYQMYFFLKNNSMCVSREIFYQMKNKDGVKNMTQIENAIHTISSIVDIAPWYLPIIATSKGLVYGDFTIVSSSGKVIPCNTFKGTLIPDDITEIKEFKCITKSYFILIVEKDTVFKKLLDEGIPTRFTRPFIMITGKGYPGINTRLFIKKLAMEFKIPIFLLVDADVYGIEIMLNYRFGSLNLAHIGDQLAIPQIRWLGVLPSDVTTLNPKSTKLNGTDKKRIINILKRPYVESNPWLKKQLQIMLDNNCKSSIEGLITEDNPN